MKLKLNKEQIEYFNFHCKEKVEVEFMENFNTHLKSSLVHIYNLLRDYDINFIFIGGVARNQYAVNRQTEDIDILVDRRDKDKIKNIPIGYMRDIGITKGKVFKFHDPANRLEVIYSGEKSGDGVNGIEFENPDRISTEIDHLPFIDLKNLIKYKLSSGIYGKRIKDFADIQDLIRANKLPLNYADDFRVDLRVKYENIWQDTY